MRFESLDDWLAWQETLNPKGIDLGLDRIQAVLARLALEHPPYQLITVAGTNGKGSCAAYAEAILRAAGHTTGRYLSPHVSRYNERIAICGQDIDDASLCRAFEEVDLARGETALTYFEFGTLAALVAFRNARVDVAVLEVGLGGRLDAVNAVDADVAVVVSVGMDHVDWLGNDLDGIAREKAGVYRPGRPAIFGQGPPPRGLLDYASGNGIDVQIGGGSYRYTRHAGGWSWHNDARRVKDLPLPALAGAHQLENAATAVAACIALDPGLPDAAIAAGIASAALPGRLQKLSSKPEIILDVGHNAEAAQAVARYLQGNARRTVCLLAMLADKDAAAYVEAMSPAVEKWIFAGLAGPRGQSGDELQQRVVSAGLAVESRVAGTVAEALATVAEELQPDERLLIAGSFHTVGEALESGVYSWQDR